jgi:hypothetical protein
MGRGGAKPKLGEGGAGKKGDENLVERKKTLEQELKDVEERLAQQLVAKSDQAAGVAGKKGKKEKLVKAKKAKKGKAPKAHPSSKAGPGFSVILTDDNPPLVAIANINKKAHAYKKGGLREGDLLVRIDGQSVRDINLNEVKAKLVARCGTILKLDLERLAVEGAGEGSATFAEWLSSADSTQQKSYVGPYSAEVILEFGPLVKSIKSGKPFQRGQAAELSLQMANSQVKRELLFVAGALQPLCKLLTDPKAAAQFNSGIKSLQNMLRISLWDELSIALSAMGKPLVQMIEKGGLVKKMLAVDLLQRIALFAPTHRVLIASGVLEAVLAQPKGIIPVALPKQTPKGWKAGKKVTGLEAKAASLVGSLARMDDSTRTRINSTTNNGVELLVRMMQRKREPAGALNDITPEGSARALEALQYTSLNVGCRAVMDRCGALESIVATLEERMEEQRKGGSRRSRKQIADEVAVSFHKADFGGSGTLNAKEFEEWFVSGGRGDGRQAKAAFRECDADGSGQISLAEVIAFVTREKPEELVDLYSACCIRNLAVSSTLRERLQGCGATGLLVAMLERAAAAAEPDAARCLVALLALLNMSALTASAEEMRDLNAEHTVAAILCSSYSPPPPPRPPSRAPDPTSAIASEGVLPERAAECDEVACAAALLLRRLVVLRTCKARLVAADVEAASTRGQGGGERLTLIGTLCSMVREGPVCSGVDAVGNEIVCHGASAAVAALQNLLAEHAIARALAIQAGVIDRFVCKLSCVCRLAPAWLRQCLAFYGPKSVCLRCLTSPPSPPRSLPLHFRTRFRPTLFPVKTTEGAVAHARTNTHQQSQVSAVALDRSNAAHEPSRAAIGGRGQQRRRGRGGGGRGEGGWWDSLFCPTRRSAQGKSRGGG